MAWSEITTEQVDANSPINDNLMENGIKNNDDDHETRMLVLESNATNWTSQLGTLISETDMGTFTGGMLNANSDVKSLLQQIETEYKRPYTTATGVEAANDYSVCLSLTFTTTVTKLYGLYAGAQMDCDGDIQPFYKLTYDGGNFPFAYKGTVDVSGGSTIISSTVNNTYLTTPMVIRPSPTDNSYIYFEIPAIRFAAGTHTITMYHRETINEHLISNNIWIGLI